MPMVGAPPRLPALTTSAPVLAPLPPSLPALPCPALLHVLIYDFDVHHGNGTQDVFEDDPSVLFISSHQGGAWSGGVGRGPPSPASIPARRVEVGGCRRVRVPPACACKPTLPCRRVSVHRQCGGGGQGCGRGRHNQPAAAGARRCGWAPSCLGPAPACASARWLLHFLRLRWQRPRCWRPPERMPACAAPAQATAPHWKRLTLWWPRPRSASSLTSSSCQRATTRTGETRLEVHSGGSRARGSPLFCHLDGHSTAQHRARERSQPLPLPAPNSAGLQFLSATYHALGARLKRLADELCGGRLVFLLEGGYDLDALGESVANTFLGEAGSWQRVPLQLGGHPGTAARPCF